MAENGKNRVLTAPQLLLAKLRYEGKLSKPEMHQQCGISDRQGARWLHYPEVQEEIVRLGKADVERAQRILERASVKAAERLELLADHKTSEPPLAETGRKAACDILQGVAIVGSKPIDQGNVNVFNFGGLGKMFEGIDTGAIRRLLDDLRNGDREKGASPVASRIAGTSHNEG